MIRLSYSYRLREYYEGPRLIWLSVFFYRSWQKSATTNNCTPTNYIYIFGIAWSIRIYWCLNIYLTIFSTYLDESRGPFWPKIRGFARKPGIVASLCYGCHVCTSLYLQYSSKRIFDAEFGNVNIMSVG